MNDTQPNSPVPTNTSDHSVNHKSNPLSRIFFIGEAPFILALIIGAATWCITHIVDRLIERPILKYQIEETKAESWPECSGAIDSGAIYAVKLKNLSQSTSFYKVFVDVEASSPKKYVDGKNPQILGILCWVDSTGTLASAIDKFSENRGPETRRTLQIERLSPHAEGTLLVVFDKTPADISIQVYSNDSGIIATKAGPITWLIQWELWITFGLLAIFILLGIWALIQINSSKKKGGKT